MTAIAVDRYAHLEDSILARLDLRRLFPEQRTDNVITHCFINPAHADTGKPNLLVNRDYGYCFRCRKHAGAYDFIALLKGWKTSDGRPNRKAAREWAADPANGLLTDTVREKKDEAVAPLSGVDVEIWHRSLFGPNLPRAYAFAERYGVSLDYQRLMKLGHTGFAYTLPVYDRTGALVNVRRRMDEGRVKDPQVRYWGEPGHNSPAWYYAPALRCGYPLPDWATVMQSSLWPDLLLVEGEFDAAALVGIGLMAISATDGSGALLGKYQHKLAELRNISVAVAFDMDEAGCEDGTAVINLLHSLGIVAYPVRWPRRFGKDASAAIAGGATADNFIRALSHARECYGCNTTAASTGRAGSRCADSAGAAA
jgi:hypothetical protein